MKFAGGEIAALGRRGQTVGDMLKHTGDELLECKNFGVTSLNEVRDKLSALSLKLKND